MSAYEMLRGHRPFALEKSMSASAMYNLLVNTRPSASVNWDNDTCDVLKMVGEEREGGDGFQIFVFMQLLHPDDRKRLQTAASMRKHPFFKELSWEEVEQKTAVPPFIPPVSSVNCSSMSPLSVL